MTRWHDIVVVVFASVFMWHVGETNGLAMHNAAASTPNDLVDQEIYYLNVGTRHAQTFKNNLFIGNNAVVNDERSLPTNALNFMGINDNHAIPIPFRVHFLNHTIKDGSEYDLGTGTSFKLECLQDGAYFGHFVHVNTLKHTFLTLEREKFGIFTLEPAYGARDDNYAKLCIVHEEACDVEAAATSAAAEDKKGETETKTKTSCARKYVGVDRKAQLGTEVIANPAWDFSTGVRLIPKREFKLLKPDIARFNIRLTEDEAFLQKMIERASLEFMDDNRGIFHPMVMKMIRLKNQQDFMELGSDDDWFASLNQIIDSKYTHLKRNPPRDDTIISNAAVATKPRRFNRMNAPLFPAFPSFRSPGQPKHIALRQVATQKLSLRKGIQGANFK